MTFSPSPGQTHVARMLTFLPGDTFDDPTVQHLSPNCLRDIGRLQGRLCQALATFDHPHAEHFMAWDISNGLVTSDELWAYAGSDVIELASWTQGHLASSDFTLDTTRRRQVIHNDAHRGNILRTPATADVSGVIDFGDMLVAPLVNELAIPGISFVSARSSPLEALTPIVVGFHEECPLESSDVSVLHDSITARAVLTALLFDFQIASCPDIAADVAAARPRVMADLIAWLAQDAAEFHDFISTALEETE